MIRTILFCLALAGFPGLSFAARVAAGPAAPPAAIAQAVVPRLAVRGAEIPVRLESVSITTTAAGSLARTAVELVFFNPNGRVLEGELQFPLLPGQEISGVAMDMGGFLREAVPVEKARGQAVFEDITRARVDPALVEKTAGNAYRMRVYPIPAGGRKTVVLRYDERLGEQGADHVYRLPLRFGETVTRFAWNGRFAGTAAPRVVKSDAGMPQVTRAAGGHGLHLERRDLRLIGEAEVRIARDGGVPVTVGLFDGAAWFVAEPRVPHRVAPRKAPSRLVLAWDASGSGSERDHAKEFALLDEYFRRLPDVEVNLVAFRDTAEAPRRFRVTRGDWSALRRALESLAYDGATNLAALDALPAGDAILLFSDGLANYGESALPVAGAPLFAIAAAARHDRVVLGALAARAGGRYIDLGAGVPAALKALTGIAPSFEVESADGAADVILAASPAGDGRLTVAGRIVGAYARVVVRASTGERITVVPDAARAREDSFAAQRWARARIDALEAEFDLNRAAIEGLGKRFRLVTRATSLIILDTAADYARNDIEPPADLRAEFERLRAAGISARTADAKAHLERVARQFRDKTAWWEREFPKGERPVQAVTPATAGAMAERREREAGDQPARQRAAPMAAPPPAPAPAAAPAMAMRDSLAAAGAQAKVAGGAAGEAAATIRLAPWAPDSPYARRLREAAAGDLYRVYLDERIAHATSTAFFLDVADLLFSRGERALALRVLSNLAEMELENRHILRVLGYRLLQAGEPAVALPVFRRVRDLSPDEPQSHRDLGLAYAALGRTQQAVDALYEVVSRPWHGRFPGVELIALAELNAVVAAAPGKVDTARIDARLLRNLPLDLRAVLTWDADNTDIDLWVTDPNGEKAFYGHRLTYQGGRMSEDFTGGYGPEEFSLRRAKPGKYKVEAQFYGERRQIVAGATTLQVRLTTGFGTAGAREQLVTLRLTGGKEVVFVGEFEVRGAQ